MYMKYRRLVLLLSIFLFTLLCGSGCGFFRNHQVILLTSNPDLLAYFEAFNASRTDYRIEARYSPFPAETLKGKGELPDILIGKWLTFPDTISRFASLTPLFKSGKVKRELFYDEILPPGAMGKEQKLIPLSFNLPCLIFNRDISGDPPVRSLSLETIRKESVAFTQQRGNTLITLGFSPFWEENFPFMVASLFGARFHMTEDGSLEWNADPLAQSVSYMTEWLESIQGGYTAEQLFSRKYLHIPPYQLLREKKILYYPMNSSELFSIPEDRFSYLGFRWISHQERVAVNDDITYIGIPARSKNKAGGKAFITWLFNPDTQVKLLEINHFKRLDRIFGLGGEFSALKEINSSALPQHYPLFTNLIPEENAFLFPEKLPEGWVRIREEIIDRWLKDAIAIENFDKKLSDQLNFFD